MPNLSFLIHPEQDGSRVSTLLRRECHCSARLIKQLKYLPDGILLDGQRVFLDHRVAAGQTLTLQLPPDPPSGWSQQSTHLICPLKMSICSLSTSRPSYRFIPAPVTTMTPWATTWPGTIWPRGPTTPIAL